MLDGVAELVKEDCELVEIGVPLGVEPSMIPTPGRGWKGVTPLEELADGSLAKFTPTGNCPTSPFACRKLSHPKLKSSVLKVFFY